MVPNLELEQELLRQGYCRVAGVDEAGRGPLAGPVVAGAVVLPADCSPHDSWLDGVDDSKALTPRQRGRCLEQIRGHAAVGVGLATSAEIDEVGIGAATRRAMLRAIRDLPQPPDHLLVDYVPLLRVEVPFLALVKGDRRCYSIAASSIVAKVTRDDLMEQMDEEFPAYGFARHKGYATAEHLRRLSIHGPSPIHRRSFSPLRTRLIPYGTAS